MHVMPPKGIRTIPTSLRHMRRSEVGISTSILEIICGAWGVTQGDMWL